MRSGLPAALRAAILERDGHRCVVCDATGVEFDIDHITEVSMGGDDAPGNLRTLCVRCHRFRHHGLAIEIGALTWSYGSDVDLLDTPLSPIARRLIEQRRRAPVYPWPERFAYQVVS